MPQLQHLLSFQIKKLQIYHDWMSECWNLLAIFEHLLSSRMTKYVSLSKKSPHHPIQKHCLQEKQQLRKMKMQCLGYCLCPKIMQYPMFCLQRSESGARWDNEQSFIQTGFLSPGCWWAQTCSLAQVFKSTERWQTHSYGGHVHWHLFNVERAMCSSN